MKTLGLVLSAAIFGATQADAATIYSYSFSVSYQSLTGYGFSGTLRADPLGDTVYLDQYTSTSAVPGNFHLSDKVAFGAATPASLTATVDAGGNIIGVSCTIIVCPNPLPGDTLYAYSGTASETGFSISALSQGNAPSEYSLGLTVGGSGKYSRLSDSSGGFSDDTFISANYQFGEKAVLSFSDAKLVSPMPAPSPVPLPAGALLLLSGLAFLGLHRKP